MSLKEKMTLNGLFKKMEEGTPIVMCTCYDYPMAHLVEEAGVDMVLVGDSLGMIMLGYDSTLPVTMTDMIRHTQAVRRGAPNVWLIADMPYMSYQPSVEDAIRNAGRFMAETGCDAVKIEGGSEVADRVAAIASAGIPIMSHLGLTPQSVSALGGYRVQSKKAGQAKKLIEDSRALEEAGTFSILLELVPDRVASLVTERSRVPIIGLGCGPGVHGQSLSFHDMFGLFHRFTPKMVKRFANAGETILAGLHEYVSEVTHGDFPQPENWFGIADEEFEELKRLLDE